MTRRSRRVPLLRDLSMCAVALLVGGGLCGGDRSREEFSLLSIVGALVIAVALLVGLSATAADLLDLYISPAIFAVRA